MGVLTIQTFLCRKRCPAKIVDQGTFTTAEKGIQEASNSKTCSFDREKPAIRSNRGELEGTL